MASCAAVSASFFKCLCFFGGGRVRVPGAGRLDRPADRLQRFPATLRRKALEPELSGHPVRDLAASPHSAIRWRLFEPTFELLQKLRREHRRRAAVVAAKIAERPQPQGVVAGLQLLDPARHKTSQFRDLDNRMAFEHTLLRLAGEVGLQHPACRGRLHQKGPARER